MSNLSELIFEGWDRKPTNTERLVAKIIEAGLDIRWPREYKDIYRVQRKVTGGEGRLALCFLKTVRGCEDIRCTYAGRHFAGIDLQDTTQKLLKNGVSINATDDPYLWIQSSEN